MANYGEQYGQGQQQQQGTDAYGNPVGQTDQYGNVPIHRTGGGGYGTGAGTEAYGGSAGTGIHGTGAHDQSSQLRRSGSSSSSEDDGMGGRKRKNKGIKEKIKEKIPGVGHNKEGEQPYGGGYGTAAGEEQPYGGGYRSAAAGLEEQPYGGGYGSAAEGLEEQPYGGGYGSAAAGEEQHHGLEKKGMMEKIKEKLPGGGGGGHHD